MNSIPTDWTVVYFNLAIVEIALDNVDAALGLYQEVATIFPAELQAYRLCGSLLLEKGRYAEAETFLKNAVAIIPNSYQLYFLLGGVRISSFVGY